MHKPKRGGGRRVGDNAPYHREGNLHVPWTGFSRPNPQNGVRIPKTALRGKAVFAERAHLRFSPMRIGIWKQP